MKIKIDVFSHCYFEEMCEKDNLNDENVENEKNKAFIDIIGTRECLIYYLDEADTKHYFKGHQNVLNLEFDDIGDDVMYNGHHFKTMTMEQAEKTIDFIENNIVNGVTYFRICCRAGMSRSRAIAEFIYRYCKENNIELEYADRNDYTTMYNNGVLLRLNHAYWKKHGLNQYENNDVDYPKDLVTPKIVEINRERNRAAYKLNENK